MIDLVDKQDCSARKYKPVEYNSSLCDRCNNSEKINGNWTGKTICHKCYMKDQNDKPDSYNSLKKEINKLEGRSRESGKRIENNCINCNKDLNSVTKGHPMRQYIDNKWTGHWLCPDCWYHLDYKHRSNTTANIIKSMRDRRLDTLHDLGNILGDNCEELTKSMFDVKRLSIENDKYSCLPNDHSPIPKGMCIEIAGKLVDLSCKIPQTTGRRFDSYRTWDFGNLQREWNKEFDIEICWCISKDGLNVERGYIFWKQDIYNSDTKEGVNRIHVIENPTNSQGNPIIPKYELRRITDNDFINKANKKWKEIINEVKKSS